MQEPADLIERTFHDVHLLACLKREELAESDRGALFHTGLPKTPVPPDKCARDGRCVLVGLSIRWHRAAIFLLTDSGTHRTLGDRP